MIPATERLPIRPTHPPCETSPNLAHAFTIQTRTPPVHTSIIPLFHRILSSAVGHVAPHSCPSYVPHTSTAHPLHCTPLTTVRIPVSDSTAVQMDHSSSLGLRAYTVPAHDTPLSLSLSTRALLLRGSGFWVSRVLVPLLACAPSKRGDKWTRLFEFFLVRER